MTARPFIPRPGRRRVQAESGRGWGPTLGSRTEDENVFDAIRLGAGGYLLKDIAPTELRQEISQKLFIGPATARTYVSRLLAKLNARDRPQLVILAYETGLVTPGRP